MNIEIDSLLNVIWKYLFLLSKKKFHSFIHPFSSSIENKAMNICNLSKYGYEFISCTFPIPLNRVERKKRRFISNIHWFKFQAFVYVYIKIIICIVVFHIINYYSTYTHNQQSKFGNENNSSYFSFKYMLQTDHNLNDENWLTWKKCPKKKLFPLALELLWQWQNNRIFDT